MVLLRERTNASVASNINHEKFGALTENTFEGVDIGKDIFRCFSEEDDKRRGFFSEQKLLLMRLQLKWRVINDESFLPALLRLVVCDVSSSRLPQSALPHFAVESGRGTDNVRYDDDNEDLDDDNNCEEASSYRKGGTTNREIVVSQPS